MVAKKQIKPQEGPQTGFLSTSADIAIYGGAAGGGKTYGLLLEPLRHIKNKHFGAVIFRRTTGQVRNEGGLWDTGMKVYSPFNPKPVEGNLEFTFPIGMRVRFAHMEHESNRFDWDGAQIPMIGFDELQHFTEKQFFYMLSRNRSDSGVPGYIRATCNPDPDSWLRTFIDWWIGDDGLPIPERAGKIRWFYRDGDTLVWNDFKFHEYAKSVTFIPSKVSDNKILLESDPGYMANLSALQYVERAQKRDGNWNIRPAAGNLFKSHWFETVEAMPTDIEKQIRYWDRASSTKTTADWTAGLHMAITKRGVVYISDVRRFRGTPLEVERSVLNTASNDTKRVMVGIEQDPGQAGEADAQNYARLLLGYEVKLNKPMVDKVTRANPFSAQCEAGNVKLVNGLWIKDFLSELESFPDGKHDDQVDAASGAFYMLTNGRVGSFNKSMVQNKIKERSGDSW